jgi:hypothetical protein
MSYYILIIPDGPPPSVWKISNAEAIRIGVSNARQSPGTYFRAQADETIWECLRRSTPWFLPNGDNPFHELARRPGEYYPRMARPNDQHPLEAPGWSPGAELEGEAIAIAESQLIALTRQLERICRTVHPAEATLEAYGHDIRNLLLLACTEVETHWRGVLLANGVVRERYTTQDYVTLCAAMRLAEYEVSFPEFPWLSGVRPFVNWGTTGRPTKELEWYDAYNLVKHSRETEFPKATLRNAFLAVSASAIMMKAQYGSNVFNRHKELRSFFHLSSVPTWPPTEVYVYPYDEQDGWIPVSFDWNSI